MKTVRHIIAVVLLLTGLATITGKAQTLAEIKAAQFTDRMTEKLKLTPSQEQKVQAINLWAAKKMEDARSKYLFNITGLLEIGKQIDRDRDLKLQEVLRPMQWTRYQHLKNELLKEDGQKVAEKEKEMREKRLDMQIGKE